MRHIGTRIILAGSGALLGLIGGALMLKPKLFLAMSEAIVEHDPSVMSEVTAPSGILVATGALMLLGGFKRRFANMALTYGAIVYGSYGLCRLISQRLHGMPSDQLIVATQIELGIAALLIALRVSEAFREKNSAFTKLSEAVI